MTWRWRRLTRPEGRVAAGLAILIWCACAPPPPPRLAPRNFSGTWTGTTSQGRAISFTVSRNLRITGLTLGYAYGGCSGSLTIPADVPLLNTPRWASAIVAHSSNEPSGPRRVVVRFVLPAPGNANGTVEFRDDPACGSSEATWTATR
jgi:hypothetical protein